MRPAGEARVRLALDGLDSGTRVLDMGGGTGAHSAVMRNEGHLPVLIDPSPAQRAKARESGLVVVGGLSQALPFADDSFGMAYFHLSLHYGDWAAALSEAARVVRPGGRLWVWTFSRKYLATSFTGRWFPSVHSHDLERFPDVSEVSAHLESLGVENLWSQVSVETVGRTAGDWEEAFRARFVSTLQLIDDDELEQGLSRFRAEYPRSDELIEIGLEFEAVVGTVVD